VLLGAAELLPLLLGVLDGVPEGVALAVFPAVLPAVVVLLADAEVIGVVESPSSPQARTRAEAPRIRAPDALLSLISSIIPLSLIG
jgi:hypothetical protein